MFDQPAVPVGFNPLIFAVDFDGTLCINSFPNIGPPVDKIIRFVKHVQKRGHKIILWTCRHDQALQDAIDWCAAQGIVWDAVNENLPERVALYGECRKVGADYYIDDRAISVDTLMGVV